LDWLSPAERFSIEVLRENLPKLKDVSFYVNLFNLRDSIPAHGEWPWSNYFWYGIEAQRSARISAGDECQEVPNNENLSRYLLLAFFDKLKQMKTKSTTDSYLWDFIELLFQQQDELPYWLKSEAEKRWDSMVKRYLIKYPSSPFFKLVLYNFYYRYKPSKNGGVLGAGPGYQTFDIKTSALLCDRVNFNCYLDVIVRGIAYKVGLSVMTAELNGQLPAGKDTIPQGMDVTNFNFLLATGYLFHLGNLLHLTPYAGLGIFSSSLPDSSKAHLTFAPRINTLYGLRIGATLDVFHFQRDNRTYNDVFGFFTPLGVRFDVGTFIGDFTKLRPDLGKVTIYANIGIQMMDYLKERIFDPPTPEKAGVSR
jgi:hypothetical protein